MPSTLYVGLDDTDVVGGDGTGRLARETARELGLAPYAVLRHQLLVHPAIPYTRRNSCNVIVVEAEGGGIGSPVLARVRHLIQSKHAAGSDPGMAIAARVDPEVVAFGQRAQREVLTEEEALLVAADHGVHLEALGGRGTGVIGALAGVGLAASEQDGRYVDFPGLRDLAGLVDVDTLKLVGVRGVLTIDGGPVEDGQVLASVPMRPLRVNGQPYLFVERVGRYYVPVIL